MPLDHERPVNTPSASSSSAPDWLARLAFLGVLLLMVAMIVGLWGWRDWLDRRDVTNHAWWLAHSEPLESHGTVEQVVVGQMTHRGLPFDAWARAEAPGVVVIRSLRAVGCGDSTVSAGGWFDHEDLDPIRAMDGQSLDGVNARVLRALPGEEQDPPCPTLVAVQGYWTFEGKRIAVLSRGLHEHARLSP